MFELSQILAITIFVVMFIAIVMGNVLSIHPINCRKILKGYHRY